MAPTLPTPGGLLCSRLHAGFFGLALFISAVFPIHDAVCALPSPSTASAEASRLAAALPSGAQLEREIQDPEERAAAAFFFFDLIEKRVKGRFPADVDARSLEYQKIMDAFGGRDAKERAIRLQRAADRSRSPSLRKTWTARFAPSLAQEFAFVAQMQEDERDRQKASEPVRTRMAVVLGILLLLPWWRVLRRKHRATEAFGSVGGAPCLPPDLSQVVLPSRAYSVTFVSGVVVDRDTITKQTDVVRQGPGTTVVVEGIPSTTPGPVTRTTHTETFVRYWIQHPNGSKSWRRFREDSFPASRGDPVSMIETKDQVLICYNGSTDQVVKFPNAIKAAGSLRFWTLLILPPLLLAGAFPWVLFGMDFQSYPMSKHLLTTTVAKAYFGGLLALNFLNIFVLKIVYRIWSYQRFKKRYYPALVAFMRAHTSAISKAQG